MPQAGYPDVECDAWVGFVASAAVSKDIIALLHAEMAKAVVLPDVKQRLTGLGFEPFAPSLEDSVIRTRAESDKWAKLIRATGLKAG
jgi:tripartite-type tricarboxylate transporter receptor subunit TctC